MRRISKRDLLRRIEALEARLGQPPTIPLAGQEAAFSVATVHDHRFEGNGPACSADTFGTVCGRHRDEHQHTG